ncbi:MAG: hypothetical protein ACYTAN_12745 [Planctomycetota bacterium]|jgi:hypothetical protein
MAKAKQDWWDCCGQPRDSRFCPSCGKSMGSEALFIAGTTVRLVDDQGHHVALDLECCDGALSIGVVAEDSSAALEAWIYLSLTAEGKLELSVERQAANGWHVPEKDAQKLIIWSRECSKERRWRLWKAAGENKKPGETFDQAMERLLLEQRQAIEDASA